MGCTKKIPFKIDLTYMGTRAGRRYSLFAGKQAKELKQAALSLVQSYFSQRLDSSGRTNCVKDRTEILLRSLRHSKRLRRLK